MRIRPFLLAPLLALALSGCAHRPVILLRRPQLPLSREIPHIPALRKAGSIPGSTLALAPSIILSRASANRNGERFSIAK